MKNFTRVNLFIEAHKLTKAILTEGDNYQLTFGLVLDYLNDELIITLKDICLSIDLEPKKARKILRASNLQHGSDGWTWRGTVPNKILCLLAGDKEPVNPKNQLYSKDVIAEVAEPEKVKLILGK